MSREWRQGELGGIALLAAGFVLVFMTLGGYFIGALIDRRLGTEPWGSVIGLLHLFRKSAMTKYVVIGDIHGMYDLLEELLSRIPAEGTLVFLGDYIDRGPDSQKVVERLIQLSKQRPCVFLRGNHEAMLLAVMDGNHRIEMSWYVNGGIETLESYGGHFPPEHLAFIGDTLPYYETEEYIFVHGGLPPGKSPSEADPEDIWWIRDPFLSSHYQWGKLVIHGHTPMPDGKPDIRPNRINLDTGAVYGGPLTALALPEMQFVFAEPE